MIITTTNTLDGYTIKEYVTIIIGETEYASREDGFEYAHKSALEKLTDKAQKLGADAIVGVLTNICANTCDERGKLILVGTAVKIEKAYDPNGLPEL